MPENTSAIAPARREASERAAMLGTYPVSAIALRTASRTEGAKLRLPLITRETVERESPATRATSSKVADGRSGSLIAASYSTLRRPLESALCVPPQAHGPLARSMRRRRAEPSRPRAAPRPETIPDSPPQPLDIATGLVHFHSRCGVRRSAARFPRSAHFATGSL